MLDEAILWFTRGMGALYVVGGVMTIRLARTSRVIDEVLAQLHALPDAKSEATERAPVDLARNRWLMIGGALTLVTGAALVVSHKIALALLAALVAHQVIYIARQFRQADRAVGMAAKDEARPAASTMNAAIFTVIVTGLTWYLLEAGRLWS